MTRLRRTVSTRLRRVRKEQNMTQTDLADYTGLLPSAICHFESGRRMPTLKNLVLLAETLKISTDYLLGINP